MATTADYVTRIKGQVSEKITALIGNLIAADASKHDTIAGEIRGLNAALSIITREAKRFQADADGDYEEAA